MMTPDEQLNVAARLLALEAIVQVLIPLVFKQADAPRAQVEHAERWIMKQPHHPEATKKAAIHELIALM